MFDAKFVGSTVTFDGDNTLRMRKDDERTFDGMFGGGAVHTEDNTAGDGDMGSDSSEVSPLGLSPSRKDTLLTLEAKKRLKFAEIEKNESLRVNYDGYAMRR